MTAGRVGLERVALPDVPWTALDRHPTRTVFQTRAWLDFLVESQAAEPVVARVLDRGEPVGWFTAAVVRRYGVRLLGSPLPGWSTSYLGCNLDAPVATTELLDGIRRFAFRDLRCLHVEVMDRSIPMSDPEPPTFLRASFHGFELDLDADDDALLAGMASMGRRNVRKGERRGVVVEEVDPAQHPAFAHEYFAQVGEAFARHGIAPAYGVERVEQLIRHLHPTGHLLLLRALTPDGEPAATGLFPGLPGATAVYWMGGSHRRLRHHVPNEAIMWRAIRTWRDRGAVRFDFGGGGEHKAKYGGRPIEVPWFRSDRFPVLEHGRELVRRAVRLRQRRAAAARLAS